MKKTIWILFLSLYTTFGLAQTKNKNLNTQLGEMKKFFLAEDYENFAKYTYPKILQMIGGKANMVNATKQAMTQMKNEGFVVVDLNFKDSSDFLKKGNELQCSITQELIMKTPQGKVKSEYTLIGISSDNGQNWTFIDTSGKDKAIMLKYFPNLHKNIVIKQKKQQVID